MNPKFPWYIYIALIFVFIGCASSQPSSVEQQPVAEALVQEETVPHESERFELDSLFAAYLNHPALESGQVGIFIQDPATRRVVYQRNAHKLFIPASNQKLVTTAAALNRLGPDFRFKTSVYAENPPDENGVVRGDIFIRGGGDPTLSGRFHDNDLTYDLRNWADSIDTRGIREVTGNIVVDANLFKDERIHPAWEYGDLSYWYAAQVSALSFNDNCVNVYITPNDTLGAPPHIRIEPAEQLLQFENNLVTVHEDSLTDYEYKRLTGSNRIIFRGKISQSRSRILNWVSVDNPAIFTGLNFNIILSENGVEIPAVVGETFEIPEYDGMELLFSYESPPLSEIIQVINRRSQNLYAETLFKMLGFETLANGSFAGGRAAVRSYLAGIGVDTGRMYVSDGSGLSRRNLISPYQLTAVLRNMYTGEHRDVYLESLALAGDEGTLQNRFRGSVADGRVMAKTGYVGFVRTLSGFVETEDNQTLIFTFMVNNFTTSTSVINELQDSIISIISSKTMNELLSY